VASRVNGGDGGSVTPEEQVDSYLNDNDASGYDDTDSIEDLTRENSVIIKTGDRLQFDPAAARINPETTVTWGWLSDDHSMEQTDSDLDFEDVLIQNEGDTPNGDSTNQAYSCTSVGPTRCRATTAQSSSNDRPPPKVAFPYLRPDSQTQSEVVKIQLFADTLPFESVERPLDHLRGVALLVDDIPEQHALGADILDVLLADGVETRLESLGVHRRGKEVRVLPNDLVGLVIDE
jgi:plastocyanin